MAISSTTRRWSFTGDGSTTIFAYTTRITDQDDLRVVVRDLATPAVETVKTITTHYTVSGVGNATGGNVTFLTAPTLNHTVIISIVEPQTQLEDIRNQGAFFPETHEEAFDHFIRIDQKQQDEIDRSVKLPETLITSDFDPTLPYEIVGSVSKAPITNATGDGWADESDWPSADDIADAAANASIAAAAAAAAAVSAGTLSPYGLNNLGLATSVGSGALTVSLKQYDGSTDPSTGTASVTIYFRHSTLTSGAVNARTVTSALSVVVPSGATLGHNDSAGDYIYVYAIDNSGTVELAVSSSNHWDEGERYTTTVMNTSADDAATLYSTAARTNVPIRLIGRMLSLQTTAGTWNSAPSEIHVGNLSQKPKRLTQAANFTPKHGIIYELNTAAARSLQLPTPRSGYMFWIKDVTGNAEDGLITLVRNGSENIEGTAASYVLDRDYGFWQVTSDGTNWWILANIDPLIGYAKETELTIAATQTIPANSSFGDIDLDAGSNATTKTYVTRGSGTLINFNVAGRYRAYLWFKKLTPAGDTSLKIELYNNTDASTHMSEIDIAVDSAADQTIFSTLLIDITTAQTAKDFKFRWATGDADTISSTFGGRIIIQYLGKA